MLQKTICTKCGELIMLAPGYCMLCGQTIPQVLPALMSDFTPKRPVELRKAA